MESATMIVKKVPGGRFLVWPGNGDEASPGTVRIVDLRYGRWLSLKGDGWAVADMQLDPDGRVYPWGSAKSVENGLALAGLTIEDAFRYLNPGLEFPGVNYGRESERLWKL